MKGEWSLFIAKTYTGQGNIIKDGPVTVLLFLLGQTRQFSPCVCWTKTYIVPTFTMKTEAACPSKTVAALLTYTQCRDPTPTSTLKTNDHKSLKLVT
jgi:hypothetical protein